MTDERDDVQIMDAEAPDQPPPPDVPQLDVDAAPKTDEVPVD